MTGPDPAPPSPPPAYSVGSEPSSDVSQVEYAVRCPDGDVWDDRYTLRETALGQAILGDSMCGCEGSGHLAVERTLPDWQPISPVIRSQTDRQPHPDVMRPTAHRGPA